MSETMPTSPTDWSQFYQQNLSNQAMFSDRVSDATIVTTTVTEPIPSSSSGHLSPERRVTRPVRRRSRVSRRTPMTLLNTDTSNFRAMVQQFTGGPSAPFSAARTQGSAQGFSLGFGPRHQQGIVNPNSLIVPGVGGGLYYSSQYQEQQQQQSHLQPYMLSMSNGGHGNQRVITSMEMSTEHGFNMESGSTQLNPSRAHDQPPMANENRSNNFLF